MITIAKPDRALLDVLEKAGVLTKADRALLSGVPLVSDKPAEPKKLILPDAPAEPVKPAEPFVMPAPIRRVTQAERDLRDLRDLRIVPQLRRLRVAHRVLISLTCGALAAALSIPTVAVATGKWDGRYVPARLAQPGPADLPAARGTGGPLALTGGPMPSPAARSPCGPWNRRPARLDRRPDAQPGGPLALRPVEPAARSP